MPEQRGTSPRRKRRMWSAITEVLEPRAYLAFTSPFINEFLASNTTGVRDFENDREDWIEIHNPTASAVNLQGWTLTDEKGDPTPWAFPSVSIPANGYLLVFASGQNITAGAELHTDFKIAQAGEHLALARPDGTPVNVFDPFPEQESDVSYGYATPSSATPQYMAVPSPRAANNATAQGVVGDTAFSVDRGFYTAPFQLTLSTPTAGATIRYTLNGSPPTATSGTVYSGPITISSTSIVRVAAYRTGWISSNVDTATYIFPAAVLQQPANPAGFPGTWAGAFGDYEMDPEVVNNPTYADRVVDGLMSLPSVSLVMPVDDWFRGTNSPEGTGGIYAYPSKFDPDNTATPLWERAVSIEYIEPDGSEGFQIDGGVQIQGGGSRNPANTPKHSMRLLFKSRYGEPKLNFDLFDGSDVDSFDSLILKAQYNNTWTHWDQFQRQRAQYVHDAWASNTQLAMGGPNKVGKYVNLYINGLYWGFYNLNERPEASWASDHYGGKAEDYDVINNEATLIDGNMNAWNAMFAVAEGGLSTPAAYAQVQQYLDLPTFVDFMIVNFYGANNDWDDHNWYAFRKSRQDGVAVNTDGFKFIAFDSERILEGVNENRTGLNNFNRPTRLFQQLRANPEFRQLFADRLHRHLFNDGALTPSAAMERYRKLMAEVDLATVPESARWGDWRRDVLVNGPATLYERDVHWINEQQRLLTSYFPQRTDILMDQMRSLGLYPNADAPEFAGARGGPVAPGTQVSFVNRSGHALYYTTDGSDPRLAGGAVSSSAILYGGPVTLNSEAVIKARVFHASTGTWSAITEGTFTLTSTPNVRVSEIMYHPAVPAGSVLDDDAYQFVELVNTGATPVALSSIRVVGVGAVTFTQSQLAAGARGVIVKNVEAFRAVYGQSPLVLGTFAGDLSHDGERVALTTPLGGVIAEFEYEDQWYDHTDGGGFSLVAVDPSASSAVLSSKGGWRASRVNGGNPGGADAGHDNNAVVINEVLPYTIAAVPFIELRNTTNAAIDVSGWFLSNDAKDRTKYAIPANTVIPANGYATFNGSQHYGGAFQTSDSGGNVYLTEASAPGVVGGYRDAVDYGPAEHGMSFGRYVKSTGASDFTTLTTATHNAANSAPLQPAVVINEVMYYAADARDEFIEVRNNSGAPVALHDGTRGWAFTSGVSFTFPAGASLSTNEVALVVGMDPAAFRAKYNIPAAVKVFGPYAGQLSNNGENVALSKPSVTGTTPRYVVVDRVNYEDGTTWPVHAAGRGSSLQRVAPSSAYGNDVATWRPSAVGGTPGGVNVLRTAPVISTGPVASVMENGPWTLGGSFVDGDAGETWTATVSYGIAANPVPLTLNANKTFTLGNAWPDSGEYPVTIRVSDSSGLTSTHAFRVTVNNVAPTATVANGGMVTEGTAASVSIPTRNDASATDASAGFFYNYDFNNDGVFEVLNSAATSMTVPGNFTDGPTTTVRVRVIDKDGGFNDYTTAITVTNVAPTATFSGTASVTEGSGAASLNFTGPSDPSTPDVAAGFRYSFDFNNDGVYEVVDSTSPTANVPAQYVADDGAKTMRGRIRDKDGGGTVYTFAVGVTNVAPVVAAMPGMTVGVGYGFTVGGSFTDPGADAWTGTIDFDDGAGPRPLAFNGRTFSFNGTITTPGQYVATVRVNDDDGGSDTETVTVNVRGATLGPGSHHVVRDGAGDYRFFENAPPTGQPTFVIPAAHLGTLVMTGGPGVDSLTIDATGGPAVGFRFNGNGGADVLAVAGGVVRLAAGGPLLRLGSVTIGNGGTLDLAGGDVVVSFAGGASPLDALRQAVRNGDLGNAGPRLVGGVAGKTVAPIANGMIRARTWGGQTISDGVDFGQVILATVFRGDANLDGVVNEADYLPVTSNLGRAGTQWVTGDVNHDGVTNADDFAVVTANLGAGSVPAPAQSLVGPTVTPTPVTTTTTTTPSVKQKVKPPVIKPLPVKKASAKKAPKR